MPDNLLLILILFVGVALVFFWQWRKGNKKEDTSGLLMIQNQLNELRSTIDGKLGDSAKMFQQQYSESVHVIRDITERLTKLDETNKQVIGFADQLQNLQDILQNPKQRGILGEYYLEAVLKNVLPPGAYKMQYEFHDTSIVDAVIFVKDKIIPIDSKFSLENYNRLLGTKDLGKREKKEKILRKDLKNRIDE